MLDKIAFDLDMLGYVISRKVHHTPGRASVYGYNPRSEMTVAIFGDGNVYCGPGVVIKSEPNFVQSTYTKMGKLSRNLTYSDVLEKLERGWDELK